MRRIQLLAVLLSLIFSASLLAETTKLKFVVNTSQPVAKEDKLFLAGNTATLGNWNPGGVALTRKSDTSFEALVELELGESIEFKITRGNWETVEKDADGEEIANRNATVQKGKGIVVGVESWADERSKPGRSSVVGTLELRRIASLESTRLVRVWLPAGYQDSTQSYPVLYLLDGQNVFDRATSAIGEEWGVDETLTKLIESKAILPMIVVSIDNSSKRVDEYTWIADGESNRKRGGNAEPFAKWIAEDLKPQIDREYRTQSKRNSTWIGGSSLGGLFSLYAVVQHNETFGSAIAMSPSLSWGNEGMNSWIESSRNRVTKPTNVWVDFGGKEGTTENGARENVERFERFQRTLSTLVQRQDSNFTVGGRLFPEAKHNESAWRERFAEAIQFIAK